MGFIKPILLGSPKKSDPTVFQQISMDDAAQPTAPSAPSAPSAPWRGRGRMQREKPREGDKPKKPMEEYNAKWRFSVQLII